MNHSPPTYPDEFELFNSASPEYQTIFWKNPNLARELSEISKKAKILWEASGCTAAISAQQTPIVTIVSNSYVSAENPNKTYLAHFYFTFSIAKILARSSRLTKNRSQDEIHTSLLNLLNKLYEIIRQHFFHVETNRFHPFLNACRKNTIIEFLLNELREELFKRKDNDFIKTSNREKKEIKDHFLSLTTKHSKLFIYRYDVIRPSFSEALTLEIYRAKLASVMDSLHETSKKNLINSIEIITPSSTHNLSSGGIIGQLILIFKGSAKTHLGSIEKEFYLFKSSFLSQGLAFRTPAYFVLPGEQGVSLSSKVADALIEIDCMSDYLTLERRMVRPRSDRVVQARQKVGSQTLKIRSFAV